MSWLTSLQSYKQNHFSIPSAMKETHRGAEAEDGRVVRKASLSS